MQSALINEQVARRDNCFLSSVYLAVLPSKRRETVVILWAEFSCDVVRMISVSAAQIAALVGAWLAARSSRRQKRLAFALMDLLLVACAFQ